MGLTIKRPITVKAIVTDTLIRETVAEMQADLRQTETELQQVEQYGRRMLEDLARSNPAQLSVARQQIEAEKAKREETKAKLLERIKEISRLEPGSEVVQGTVEGTVEVAVGDHWDKVFAAEIVVKDGIIIEIRES